MAGPGRPVGGALEEPSGHSAHSLPRAEVWSFYPNKFIQGDDLQGFTSSTRSSTCLVRADGEVIPALAWILGPETDRSPHSRKPTSLPA